VDSDDFHIGNVLEAAIALDLILKKRVHPKKNWYGETILSPSKLGIDLGLPKILKRLNSKTISQKEKGLEDFQNIWMSLSAPTRTQVEESIGWYEPENLDWDDIRSNRRPKI
jgi:hypothetical protein